MKSLNTFADHAPKPEWIADFFRAGAPYLKENNLGRMQIAFFKRFLSDAGLIAKNATTPLFEAAKTLGAGSEEAWGLALAELANRNPQVRWYVKNMETGRSYGAREIVEALVAEGVKEKDAHSILKSFKRLCETPLGRRLHFGASEDEGRALAAVARTKPVAPTPRVFLYALYRFAETCGGYWEFTLTRLLDFAVEAEGVSPAEVFAMTRAECEATLNGLARSNPEFLSFTTTHDLELVHLAEDKTSADVLAALFHA